MNKAHLPLILSKEQWLVEAAKLFPHQTPEQREQLWQECQKAESKLRDRFYERRANAARFA